MKEKGTQKKGGLLKTPRQINMGAMASGIGFLLYLLLRGLEQELLAAIIVFVMGCMN